MAKRVSRRDVTRAVPILLAGSSIAAVARFLAACSSSGDSLNKPVQPENKGVPPTDGNEYVPPSSNAPPPVDTGDAPPVVPNPVWESRAKQLEDLQAQKFGAVFTSNAATNGVMAGKERSHVPQATVATQGNYKRVTVLVQHVMGSNGIDSGAPATDAAADAAKMDAGLDAAKDATATKDAGDAGTTPVDSGLVVHYITTIYIRANLNGKDTVVGLWEFASTDPAPPSAVFTMPEGVTTVNAYEWCTLHGLWKSDDVPL